MLNIKKIKDLMYTKKITMYRLAKICNVTKSRVIRVLNGTTKNPHIDIVISIAKALEVTIDEIVIKDLSESKEG
ncbi:XRE family transcriptional regulator [Eubacterium sp. AF22-8LB]|uniref:helix-turn-helix domain-containing protein n=1 Tax=Eubacterium sp. AF22-8LB TaxID=2292232 RepID=UPI000E4A854B|nr:helix-turn-helix transcriptional regulator [Eubacterium sp. AF22-8LB]RGS29383.1 XRE family transcriptional regulator [Eubacterium sp. AF22-8LB]